MFDNLRNDKSQWCHLDAYPDAVHTRNVSAAIDILLTCNMLRSIFHNNLHHSLFRTNIFAHMSTSRIDPSAWLTIKLKCYSHLWIDKFAK